MFGEQDARQLDMSEYRKFAVSRLIGSLPVTLATKKAANLPKLLENLTLILFGKSKRLILT